VLTSGELGLVAATDEDAFDEARRRLQTLVREGERRGVPVQTFIAAGSAATAILDAARENDADLILLGIESKGILERALLGTTAEHVVRTGEVPVLSVPVHVRELRR
jgi:nucleotide-binding universal stress UspA family protein